MAEDSGFETPDDVFNSPTDSEYLDVGSDIVFEPFPIGNGGFMIVRKLVKLPEFED
jgi:hypothetical protein